MQVSISVFAPDVKSAECEQEHEITLEQFQKELAEDPDENNAAVVVKLEDQQSPSISERAGPSAWKPSSPQPQTPESSDEELCEEGNPSSFGERRKKRLHNRRATRAFIDSMASVVGERPSDWEEDDEEDARCTASDDSFIDGDDIFD